MEHARSRSDDSGVASPVLFFLGVIAGCLFILFAKHQGYPAWATTSGPVVLMIFYAILVSILPMFRLRFDQAGDNLYYMGFLFTLTSLGMSLYQFRAELGAEPIIQNFGIAVGSTIAGVALRVLFTQMRRDPIDVERSARLELAEASRRVRRELEGTVLELSHFRRSAQQAVIEGFDEVRDAMGKANERILHELQSLADRSVKPFEATSEASSAALRELTGRTAASLESAAQDLIEQNERLSASAALIAGALSNVSVRLAEMQTPDRVIEVQLTGPISEISRSVDHLASEIVRWSTAEDGYRAELATTQAEARDNAQTFKILTDAVISAAGAMEDVAKSWKTQMQRVELVVDANESLKRRIEGSSSGAVDAATEALSAAVARERLTAAEGLE